MTLPPTGARRQDAGSGEALWIENGSRIALRTDLAKAGDGTIYIYEV